MGSILSFLYQTQPQSAKMVEKTKENDEFYDAIENVNETGNVNSRSYPENFETDAVESKFVHVQTNISNITSETIADIEKELDYYEKVSLVFLLYDNEDVALQFLLKEQAYLTHGVSANILSYWARSKHTSSYSWQNKFIEALCVIQNYALLRRLGFDKDEMRTRYLPHVPYCSRYLNIVVKALYCLCEDLSPENTKILLIQLANDFKKLDKIFEDYGGKYFEMCLLHCFSREYIKKNNLTNLINVLKKNNLVNNAEKLESVMKIYLDRPQNDNTPNFTISKPIENYINPIRPSCSDKSIIGINSIVKTVSSSNCYAIDENNVGICLIINQKNFFKVNRKSVTSLEYLHVPDYDLETRHGTDVDKEALRKVFSELGFTVKIYEDLNHKRFMPVIEEVMQKFTTKDSCFFICILSHGIENQVYAADSLPIGIDNIRDKLHDRNYPQLLGKPKVLIIQSCQGNEIQKVLPLKSMDENVTDGPTNTKKNELNLISDETGHPEKQDLLLCMSTVAGFASVRHPNDGCWYIQELCKTIDEECEQNHFQDILTTVNRKVSEKRWSKKDEGIVTMVPEFTTTLNKNLFLRKIKKYIL